MKKEYFLLLRTQTASNTAGRRDAPPNEKEEKNL